MSVQPLVLLLGLGLVTAGAAPVEPAAPRPGALELRWSAPPQCPDRAQLLATIDATLGEVTDHERRPVTVHGRMQPQPEGFVLHLEIDDGHAGARELRGASCEELTEAAALVIAMTIDPRLLEILQAPSERPELARPDPASMPDPPAEPEPEPAPEPAPAPEPEPAPPPSAPSDPTAPGPDARPPAPLYVLARAQVGLAGGPLPGPTALVGLSLGLGGHRWRAELSGSYWTPRTTTSALNPAVGVHAQLWALGASGCGEPRTRTLSFPLCAGLLAGAVHARGTGDLQPTPVATRWLAATVEPGLTWWLLSRVGLAFRLRGHAALARPSLRSSPSGVVFTSAPVGGSLDLGLELRLP